MSCIECHDAERKVFARDLCQRCYYRLRRSGTIQRQNAVNQSHRCLVEGCGDAAWAKGLCTAHYLQAESPLKPVWRRIRSRAGEGNYPVAWDEFSSFCADVGERPSLRHQLRKIDGNLPWTKENTHWLEPVSAAETRGWSKTDQAKYMRDWSAKRRFNLGPQDYDDMMKAQQGCCAICQEPESQVHHKTGEVQRLSIDHDHKTGDVRGLLCHRCNTLLGRASDDDILLLAAAVYLQDYRRWKRTHEVPG